MARSGSPIERWLRPARVYAARRHDRQRWSGRTRGALSRLSPRSRSGDAHCGTRSTCLTGRFRPTVDDGFRCADIGPAAQAGSGEAAAQHETLRVEAISREYRTKRNDPAHFCGVGSNSRTDRSTRDKRLSRVHNELGRPDCSGEPSHITKLLQHLVGKGKTWRTMTLADRVVIPTPSNALRNIERTVQGEGDAFAIIRDGLLI
jgi:hypothetical protein